MTTATAPAYSDAEMQRIVWDTLSGATVALLGPANVVMQLARLPVGHGVAKSKVLSGRSDLHPFKRSRTTFSYLTISLLGTDDERRAYRDEVNRAHRQVRSGPDDPNAYNAFDTELQLWVAACLYYGTEQALDLFTPGLLDSRPGLREAHYRYCSRLGTTLQVPEESWPTSRAEFGEYWRENVEKIEMDDVSRTYLLNLISLRKLKVPPALGRRHQFIVSGFLPEPFREELGLHWNPDLARKHEGVVRRAALFTKYAPGPLRRFPMNAFHLDTQRRIRQGKEIV